jgi:hypothetical protein
MFPLGFSYYLFSLNPENNSKNNIFASYFTFGELSSETQLGGM